MVSLVAVNGVIDKKAAAQSVFRHLAVTLFGVMFITQGVSAWPPKNQYTVTWNYKKSVTNLTSGQSPAEPHVLFQVMSMVQFQIEATVQPADGSGQIVAEYTVPSAPVIGSQTAVQVPGMLTYDTSQQSYNSLLEVLANIGTGEEGGQVAMPVQIPELPYPLLNSVGPVYWLVPHYSQASFWYNTQSANTGSQLVYAGVLWVQSSSGTWQPWIVELLQTVSDSDKSDVIGQTSVDHKVWVEENQYHLTLSQPLGNEATVISLSGNGLWATGPVPENPEDSGFSSDDTDPSSYQSEDEWPDSNEPYSDDESNGDSSGYSSLNSQGGFDEMVNPVSKVKGVIPILLLTKAMAFVWFNEPFTLL